MFGQESHTGRKSAAAAIYLSQQRLRPPSFAAAMSAATGQRRSWERRNIFAFPYPISDEASCTPLQRSRRYANGACPSPLARDGSAWENEGATRSQSAVNMMHRGVDPDTAVVLGLSLVVAGLSVPALQTAGSVIASFGCVAALILFLYGCWRLTGGSG